MTGRSHAQIDPAVDPDMTVFVVNTLTSELGNYVFRRLGIDPLQIGREGLRVMDTNLVEETFDDLVRVLQYGLASRER